MIRTKSNSNSVSVFPFKATRRGFYRYWQYNLQLAHLLVFSCVIFITSSTSSLNPLQRTSHDSRQMLVFLITTKGQSTVCKCHIWQYTDVREHLHSTLDLCRMGIHWRKSWKYLLNVPSTISRRVSHTIKW
jgi:hypothetical protein